MNKFKLILALLLLCSCNTPEARLARLQHDFWKKFARQNYYEIKLKNEVLHLPLPPPFESSGEQKLLAENLQKEARSIEKEKLGTAGKKQLTLLTTALDDCVLYAGNPLFDPSRCVIAGHLEERSKDPDLPLFLEKIPAYYAQIEQHWQVPDARFVSKAVAGSQTALDLLIMLEKKSGENGVHTGAAQAAVKDFIGLCQSALLK
jgi:hypothetical protein